MRDLRCAHRGVVLVLCRVRQGLETTWVADEFTALGARMGRKHLPVSGSIVQFAGWGDRLILLRSDGSLLSVDPDGAHIASVVCGLPASEAFAVHPISHTELLIVDRSAGQLGWADAATKHCQWETLDAPEIANARSFFDGRWRASASEGHTAGSRGFVVGASGVDSYGDFWFILQPVNRAEGAVLLRTRRSVGIVARLRLQLPAKNARPLLPTWLRVAGNTAYGICRDGYVDQYVVS